MESKSEHDVLNRSVIAFIGDDTGLLKKVKINAKCTVFSHLVAYGEGSRKRRKIEQPVLDQDGNPIERVYAQKPGKLTLADNQLRTEYETDVKFKLIGRSGE